MLDAQKPHLWEPKPGPKHPFTFQILTLDRKLDLKRSNMVAAALRVSAKGSNAKKQVLILVLDGQPSIISFRLFRRDTSFTKSEPNHRFMFNRFKFGNAE